MTMTLQDALARLESLGHEKVRAQTKKNGAMDKKRPFPPHHTP